MGSDRPVVQSPSSPSGCDLRTDCISVTLSLPFFFFSSCALFLFSSISCCSLVHLHLTIFVSNILASSNSNKHSFCWLDRVATVSISPASRGDTIGSTTASAGMTLGPSFFAVLLLLMVTALLSFLSPTAAVAAGA